jgi:hypothetical protein
VDAEQKQAYVSRDDLDKAVDEVDVRVDLKIARVDERISGFQRWALTGIAANLLAGIAALFKGSPQTAETAARFLSHLPLA